MRVICFILLLIFLAALGIFAVQNQAVVTVHYLNRNLECSLALAIAAAYLIGMFTGWTVLGAFRRTVRRVSERRVD